MNKGTRQELVQVFESFAEERMQALNQLRDVDTIDAEALGAAAEICSLPVFNGADTGNVYLFAPCEEHMHFLVFSEKESEEGVLELVDHSPFEYRSNNPGARFEFIKRKSNNTEVKEKIEDNNED